MSVKEAISKAPRGRVRRTPTGKRDILKVIGGDENYSYRIVNDLGDRVNELMDEDWELVPKDAVRVGDKRSNQATPEGSVAQISVGQGVKAFVMRKRKDWYEEDRAEKQKEVDRFEAATKERALDGTYGKLEESVSKG